MKTVFQFKALLFVLMLFPVSSCETAEQDQPAPNHQKRIVVVIKDQSASIQEDATDIEKQQLWMKRYLHEQATPGTDFLMMYVNSSSGSAVNHYTFAWKESPAQNGEGYQSETDKLLEENAKQSSDRLQAKKLQRQLLERLFSQGSTRSNQTQIIELIPELDRLTSGYETISIIILSDMVQESTMRDFSTGAPGSKQQAETMAAKDVEKIRKSFGIRTKPMDKVKTIDVLVPPKTDQRALVILPYYYQEFYSNWGFSGKISWSSL